MEEIIISSRFKPLCSVMLVERGSKVHSSIFPSSLFFREYASLFLISFSDTVLD